MALNVALSWDTSWLCARERRDLLAKMLELRLGLGRPVLVLLLSWLYIVLVITGPGVIDVLVAGASGTVFG